MNRKQVFLLAVLVLVTAALATGSLYQYRHHQNVTDARVLKVVQQRDDYKNELEATKAQLNSAQAEVRSVSAETASACNQLAKLKQVNPVCVKE